PLDILTRRPPCALFEHSSRASSSDCTSPLSSRSPSSTSRSFDAAVVSVIVHVHVQLDRLDSLLLRLRHVPVRLQRHLLLLGHHVLLMNDIGVDHVLQFAELRLHLLLHRHGHLHLRRSVQPVQLRPPIRDLEVRVDRLEVALQHLVPDRRRGPVQPRILHLTQLVDGIVPGLRDGSVDQIPCRRRRDPQLVADLLVRQPRHREGDRLRPAGMTMRLPGSLVAVLLKGLRDGTIDLPPSQCLTPRSRQRPVPSAAPDPPASRRASPSSPRTPSGTPGTGRSWSAPSAESEARRSSPPPPPPSPRTRPASRS